jgi:hypothetical protein
MLRRFLRRTSCFRAKFSDFRFWIAVEELVINIDTNRIAIILLTLAPSTIDAYLSRHPAAAAAVGHHTAKV